MYIHLDTHTRGLLRGRVDRVVAESLVHARVLEEVTKSQSPLQGSSLQKSTRQQFSKVNAVTCDGPKVGPQISIERTPIFDRTRKYRAPQGDPIIPQDS